MLPPASRKKMAKRRESKLPHKETRLLGVFSCIQVCLCLVYNKGRRWRHKKMGWNGRKSRTNFRDKTVHWLEK